MILILADENDVHATHVIAELRRRGAAHVRYHLSAFPNASRVTIDGTDDVRTSITHGGDLLDLAAVRSVWFRRPGTCTLAESLRDEDATWLRSECSHTFSAIWASMSEALWVSDPQAIRAASWKAYQLREARRLGLQVPRFIVTNDVGAATNFVRECGTGGAVVKALAEPFVLYKNDLQARLLYTHRLTGADLDSFAAVANGPTFLQAYIDKVLDVRVTVIGDAVFAVGIDPTQHAEARVDFRRLQPFDLPHEVLRLPDALARRCVDLVRRLGLRFGAIDLVRTADGEYFFLEINPNGQWLWIEWITGVPLVSTMCDLLMGEQAA